MTNKEYTLSEITELSGLPAQTIQRYMEEHLLTKPPTRGLYTLYGQTFMNRLMLIIRMKENQLGINEIRQRVTNLSDDQVRELLALNYDTFAERYKPTKKVEIQVPELIQDDRSLNTGITNSSIPEPQANLQASRWQRVEIIPGIEISIKENLLRAHRENIQAAVNAFVRVINHNE